ncbi:MAG: HYR domain-containing protein [Flavobacteriaceae bacterium]
MKTITHRLLLLKALLLCTISVVSQNIEMGPNAARNFNNFNFTTPNVGNQGANRAPNETIYLTDPNAANFQAIPFSSQLSTAPKVGDMIRFTNSSTNRLITLVEVGLFHNPSDPKFPITLEISMYSDCPAPNNNTQGNACGTGPGTLIPGSTITLPNFLPSDGLYLRSFNFPTPVNTYGYGDEISVMFKAVSVGTVYILGNTPILVGSNPLGEPSESRYSGCGENLSFSGCDFTLSPTYNNIMLNVLANADTNPPTAQCQNVTATLNPILGTVTVPASAINNGSFDGEGSITLSSSKTSFNCSDVGANTVTLTVTDRAGNTSTCTATVTIQQSPIVMGCPADKVFEANTPNCTYQYSFSDIITGNQSCNPVTITQIGGPPNNSFLPIGDTVFTYQGTTTTGLSATCSYTVTIVDTTPPVITNCSSNITVNATNGSCGALVTFPTPNFQDNCIAFFAQTQGLSSGATFPVGTTTNRWVAADFGGNQTECSFTVTVVDTTPPSITCNFSTVNAQTDPGQCTRTVISTAFNPTFSDNCSAVTITNDFNNSNTLVGAALPVGQTTVTWTAEDTDGNTNTCATTFFIIDTEDPQITCPINNTRSTSPGICGYTVVGTELDATFTDNCTNGSMSNDFNGTNSLAGTLLPEGDNTITWTADDGNGNTVTCTTTIMIEDNEAPSFDGQGVIAELLNYRFEGTGTTVVNNASNPPAGTVNGILEGIITQGSPGILGNGSLIGVNSFNSSSYLNTQWNTNLTTSWSISFKTENIQPDTSVFYIFGDFGAGQFRCFTNGVAGADNWMLRGTNWNDVLVPGGATVAPHTTTFVYSETEGNIKAYLDGVLVNTVAQPPLMFVGTSPFKVGGYGSSRGLQGNALMDEFKIFSRALSDTEVATLVNPPASTCPSDIVVVADPGSCGAVVSYTAPIATDNCSAVTLTQTSGLASGEIFPVGITTNTFLATDANGNTATCSFTVTVNDTEAPTALCQNITVPLDASGNASITANDVNGGSTDACGIATTSIDVSSFDCSNIGPNNVTLTVTDVNGNSSQCTAIVTIEDNEAPSITCYPLPVNAQTDPGQCTHTVISAVFNPTFSDNCSSATITNDFNGTDTLLGAALPLGETTVVWTVDDGNGNTNTCSTTFVIIDAEDPQILCATNDTRSTDAGQCSYSVVGTEFDASFTDNCTNGSITNDLNGTDTLAGEVLLLGDTIITWTADDGNGNSVSCTLTITVQDNEAPTALCQNITVQLDVNGNATITASDVDGESNDACGIASTTIDISSFDCSNVGTNNVVLTVTDVNGNSSQCTAIVTVEDTIAPNAVCQNITVQLDANGNASITANDVDGGSTDACGIASTSIDVSSFDCSGIGLNNVILTVTDVNGNSSQCIAIVTVEDTIAPSITCPTNLSVTTDSGECGAVVTFANAVALDNCGIASIIQTGGPTNGSLFPVGTNTVEYTATDVNGNTTVCTFTVTVTDTTPPVTVCQNITVQLDAAGTASIVASNVDGGSTDPCGLAALAIDIDTFDCSNVGPNNVTLTATDTYGNSSTCVAIVTVEDVTAPVAVCQNITVQLDASGTVTIDPASLDGGSTDACSIDASAYSVDIDTFDCSNVGDNNVVLTVTDVNGNTATCNAIVTVEDVTAPELVCQDITVQLDANGEATIVPEDVIASNIDACGTTTTSVDINSFSCDDIGTPVLVTVFSEDSFGNISSCTALVTVEDVLGPQFDSGTLPVDVVRQADENGEYMLEDFTVGITVTDNCSDPLLPIVIGQDPAVGTILTPGIYDITLSAIDDLGNVTDYVFILTVEEFLGTEEINIDLSTVTLYPNPAKAVINISNPKQIALEQLAIYDITGRLVKAFNLSKMGSETSLDVSSLASASYLVVIKGEGILFTKQLVKE